MSAEDDSSDCSTAWVVDHLQAARSWLIPRLEAMLGRDGSADDVAQEASMRALSESPKACFDAWHGLLREILQLTGCASEGVK